MPLEDEKGTINLSFVSWFRYKNESKVLQYFSDVRGIPAVLDAFAEVVMVIDQTGL